MSEQLINCFNHDQVAKEAGIADCKVKCEKCGSQLSVKGGNCLKNGWPECCGYTMTLLPVGAP